MADILDSRSGVVDADENGCWRNVCVRAGIVSTFSKGLVSKGDIVDKFGNFIVGAAGAPAMQPAVKSWVFTTVSEVTVPRNTGTTTAVPLIFAFGVVPYGIVQPIPDPVTPALSLGFSVNAKKYQGLTSIQGFLDMEAVETGDPAVSVEVLISHVQPDGTTTYNQLFALGNLHGVTRYNPNAAFCVPVAPDYSMTVRDTNPLSNGMHNFYVLVRVNGESALKIIGGSLTIMTDGIGFPPTP